MTQILLPSPVGLHNERIWPPKVHSLDAVGRELYHLREGSRHLRLLHHELFHKVNRDNVEKQLKSFPKFEVQCDKQVEIIRQSNRTVTLKQDAKLCARAQQSCAVPSEMTRRSTRQVNNADLDADDRSFDNVPASVDLNKESCVTSCSQDVPSSIVLNFQSRESRTLTSRRRRSRSSDLQCRRKSVRQALLREQSEASAKRDVKQDLMEDAEDPHPEATISSSSGVVSVPTWRIIQVPKRYVIEGTENMTDEAYHKRHHRLEADEKRRKRWDLQRQRELSAYESARVVYGDTANTAPASSDGIEVAYIEVVDDGAEATVPHSLQNLRQIDFLEVPNGKKLQLSSKRKCAKVRSIRQGNSKRSKRG